MKQKLALQLKQLEDNLIIATPTSKPMTRCDIMFTENTKTVNKFTD